MSPRNDDLEEEWLRAQIAEFLKRGWTLEKLAAVGITREVLIRLGFRDDHPSLFDDPQPRKRKRRRAPRSNEAASPSNRDAASRSLEGGD